MSHVIVFPVFCLEADGLSVPRGSFGLVEDTSRPLWSVRWFPPAQGLSSGIRPDLLAEAGEWAIPVSWISP